MVADKAVKSVVKKNRHQTLTCAKSFPKGSHYLITCIFIMHLLCTVYSVHFDSQCSSLGVGGLCQYSFFTQRENHCLGRYSKGPMENFLASRVFGCCFSHYTVSQQDPSHGSWGEYEPCSEGPYLGSEYNDPEIPRIGSSDWILILWPEVVKHLEGTHGLGFLFSQHELYSYWFAFTKLVTPSSRVRT